MTLRYTGVTVSANYMFLPLYACFNFRRDVLTWQTFILLIIHSEHKLFKLMDLGACLCH
jgi:hypothetical protein